MALVVRKNKNQRRKGGKFAAPVYEAYDKPQEPVRRVKKGTVESADNKAIVNDEVRSIGVSTVPTTVSRTEPKQNYADVYNFAEVSLERTDTNHLHKLGTNDKELLTEYVKGSSNVD
ncbi:MULTISPECIES: hypothetical protein [Furfurilactobacillus]|uniref:Uncharacterized protein n=1 Tax=Furfurilactobacillus rossiae TaxID=231049 RepID=A0A7C9IZB6_9LACO|nr:hypothetical protein [Furfurilactobacillus milii]MYV05922.1 hypothetical protein [Furfurilactobacillus milii]